MLSSILLNPSNRPEACAQSGTLNGAAPAASARRCPGQPFPGPAVSSRSAASETLQLAKGGGRPDDPRGQKHPRPFPWPTPKHRVLRRSLGQSRPGPGFPRANAQSGSPRGASHSALRPGEHGKAGSPVRTPTSASAQATAAVSILWLSGKTKSRGHRRPGWLLELQMLRGRGRKCWRRWKRTDTRGARGVREQLPKARLWRKGCSEAGLLLLWSPPLGMKGTFGALLSTQSTMARPF